MNEVYKDDLFKKENSNNFYQKSKSIKAEKKKKSTVILVRRKTFKSMGSPLESTANVSLSFTSLIK
jgi:hypothetical protein